MREQKIYKSSYDGKYYEYLEGDILDIRKQPINDFVIEEVKKEDLIKGGLYVLDNGRIVFFIDVDEHFPHLDSQLVSGVKYNELTKKQLKLYWTLVKNRENSSNGFEE